MVGNGILKGWVEIGGMTPVAGVISVPTNTGDGMWMGSGGGGGVRRPKRGLTATAFSAIVRPSSRV